MSLLLCTMLILDMAGHFLFAFGREFTKVTPELLAGCVCDHVSADGVQTGGGEVTCGTPVYFLDLVLHFLVLLEFPEYSGLEGATGATVRIPLVDTLDVAGEAFPPWICALT